MKSLARLLIFPGLALALGGCAMITPAVQSSTAPGVVLSGKEKIAVLLFHVSGYPQEDILTISQRVSNYVELALLREGWPVILRSSFQKTLDNLKYQPAEDIDVPTARLMHKLIGADIVIEGTVSTVRTGVVNTFKETIYVLNAKSGRLILMTTGEGDSEIYVNCAQDVAAKIKQSALQKPP